MKGYVIGGLLAAVAALPLAAFAQGAREDAGVEAATQQYRSTGKAPTLREGDVEVYPFGHAQPTLRCAEIRACIVQLQPGEEAYPPILPDAESWSVAQYFAGSGAARVTLLAVKPLLCGVSTNLVVPTTRRIYDLSLVSAPCGSRDDWNAAAQYTRRIRFYYPDDQARQWVQPQRDAARRDSSELRIADGADLERLHFDYTWKTSNGFPWQPAQVFDDGVHTYIRVPAEARRFEQPVLYVVEESGARSVLNYSTPAAGSYFKTDRIVSHLAFVIAPSRGNGRPKVLHIYNRAAGRPAASARHEEN